MSTKQKCLHLIFKVQKIESSPQKNERNILLPYTWIIHRRHQPQELVLLTSPQVLFLGFATHSIDPQNRLHVTLVDGWRVQYGFGGPGQAHRQTCSAHQDTCHTWCICTTHTHRHTRVKKALSMKKSFFSKHAFKKTKQKNNKTIAVWPASAGWNGPDPVRFFTGRAGTLQKRRQKDSRLMRQQHRRRIISFKMMFYMFHFSFYIFLKDQKSTSEEQQLTLLKSLQMCVRCSAVRVICSDGTRHPNFNTDTATQLDSAWHLEFTLNSMHCWLLHFSSTVETSKKTLGGVRAHISDGDGEAETGL